MSESLRHALSIDVEDPVNIVQSEFFGVEAAPTEAVVRNTMRMMDILGEYNIRATFFVLGEVAETFPSLVRRMADDGHEVGAHGYRHIQFFRMNREQALEDLCRAKKIIEDITGGRVRGHRAPAFSIRPDTAWALETVAEAGFDYDSSIVPCKMRRYGWAGFSKDIHRVKLPGGKTIIEAPMSTVAFLGKEMPACGGGYLRHFPLWFTRWALRKVRQQRPAIVYVHPYDIDCSPLPIDIRVNLNNATFRQKVSLLLQMRRRSTVERKLRQLFSEHTFVPLDELIDICL